MKYAIIGSGKIGTALARTFARKNIEVGIANSRGPETLTSLARELGSSVFLWCVVLSQVLDSPGDAEENYIDYYLSCGLFTLRLY
jgi:predicted dinucleotide-binding enzyme